MNFKKYLLLNWRRFVIILIVFALAILLHEHLENVIGDKDSVFFLVAIMVLPIYVIVYLIFNLFVWFYRKSKK